VPVVSDVRPSVTAQRVAAYRLTFARIGTSYGQPEADEALARNVAGAQSPDFAGPDLAGPMARYLRGRTTFFDRAVVNALDREVAQVVSVGAGYDGRAWRFAKEGVHWWEVDQPGTQADKQLRLSQLGIDSSHVHFVAHDLGSAGLATRLMAAGLEADAPSLMIAEGIAIYLDAASLARALDELRSVATAGSRLAISLGASSSSPSHTERRARLEAVLACWGEPARNSIGGRHASLVLAAAGWRPLEVSERSGAAGFVMAAPNWCPARGSQSPSRSRRGAERRM
jgi:methyltransferase (TIGR00027 family)